MFWGTRSDSGAKAGEEERGVDGSVLAEVCLKASKRLGERLGKNFSDANQREVRGEEINTTRIITPINLSPEISPQDNMT